MSDLGKVLVLAGGVSFEREVSLASGRRVTDALCALGVDAELVDVDASLLDRLLEDPPDAVFIAMHGNEGEDGALRDVLDIAGVPYVGASGAAARLAFDKTVAKAVVSAAGIDVPASVAFSHTAVRDLGGPRLLERAATRLRLPLVVKPARGGSALGLTIVRDLAELAPALVTCFSYDSLAVLEEYVAGVEIAVGVIDEPSSGEARALPPVEIHPLSGVFDYAARYTAGKTEYHVPARLDREHLDRAQAIAVRAHRALGLRDLSRTDLIVAPDGRIVYLETNVAPGMTATSLLPLAARHVGLDIGALCRDLLWKAANQRTAAAP
ncbi:MAG: D-alanine--D-alanine ligase [Acidothermus sp.]|nr:D-alanine--D-alanine ligase [Acidothermus sp.]MCL6537354.1 D-alanine--D-alanine ligase [Acidothermus sp.]